MAKASPQRSGSASTSVVVRRLGGVGKRENVIRESEKHGSGKIRKADPDNWTRVIRPRIWKQEEDGSET